jgi:hypothetical protein
MPALAGFAATSSKAKGEKARHRETSLTLIAEEFFNFIY